MLVKLIGWLYIAMAIFILAKPGIVKEWIKNNKSKKPILLLPIIVGALMILIGFQYKGILATIVVILGCLGVIKGAVFFLYADIYKKTMDWTLALPVSLFRVGGCFHIVIGIIILSLR